MAKNKTTSYLLKTPAGYRKVTRRIGKRHAKRAKNLVGAYVLLGTVLGSLYLHQFGNQTIQLIHTASAQEISTQTPSETLGTVANEGETADIKSGQTTVSPSPSPLPSPSEWDKQDIVTYIYQVFGEHGDAAIAVATCESGLIPHNIGDRNLITWHGDDIVGDSVGIFQIRTGGNDFNRAKANGMTPDEFRTYLKNPKNNIDYAKEIFDRQGWYPWTCKKVLN